MHEFIFWSFFIVTICIFGLLFIKVIYRDRDLHFLDITTGQLKVIFAIIVGPVLCAFSYIFSPFNSLQSFAAFGAGSFFISIIISPINKYIKQNTEAESDEFNITKSGLFFSLVSLVIPSTIIYTVFVLMLKGFHSPW